MILWVGLTVLRRYSDYGENPANVEIDSVNPTDRTFYARFEIKKYTVTASAVSEDDDKNKQGNKITYGNEHKAQVQVIVNHGGSVTFTAVPVDGSVMYLTVGIVTRIVQQVINFQVRKVIQLTL